MYHSKQNSLVWCKVPKAGSSTWTYNFLKLAGVNPKEVTTNFVAVTIMIFVFSENPQSSEGSLSKAGQQQSHASEWKFQKCWKIFTLCARTHSDSWLFATHLSESCRPTGTSWKTSHGTSMRGTGSTTRCTASTSWRSTGSRRRRTQQRRRSWAGSRPGGSLSPTCSTPP